MTDVNFPAGSGKYLCVCPEGKQGDLCDEDVDECLSAPCTVGKCINTASGYRCECPPGLRGKNRERYRHLNLQENRPLRVIVYDRRNNFLFLAGLTCLEDINECERKPCFQGVQCFNSFGSYGCGPCPKGMLGNGTTCTGKHEHTVYTFISEQLLKAVLQIFTYYKATVVCINKTRH